MHDFLRRAAFPPSHLLGLLRSRREVRTGHRAQARPSGHRSGLRNRTLLSAFPIFEIRLNRLNSFAATYRASPFRGSRIVNAPDLVPKLPPQILGFTHIDTEQMFNSTGKVNSSLSCWHALATYLSLIDPTRQPGADCQLTPAVARLQPVIPLTGAARPESISAGGVTVNITVNVGGSPTRSMSLYGSAKMALLCDVDYSSFAAGVLCCARSRKKLVADLLLEHCKLFQAVTLKS
jgi:hypothetical protein